MNIFLIPMSWVCCLSHYVWAKAFIRVGYGQIGVWREKLAQTWENFSGRRNSMKNNEHGTWVAQSVKRQTSFHLRSCSQGHEKECCVGLHAQRQSVWDSLSLSPSAPHQASRRTHTHTHSPSLSLFQINTLKNCPFHHLLSFNLASSLRLRIFPSPQRPE